MTELIYPAVQANCIYEVRISAASTVRSSLIMIWRMSTSLALLLPDPWSLVVWLQSPKERVASELFYLSAIDFPSRSVPLLNLLIFFPFFTASSPMGALAKATTKSDLNLRFMASNPTSRSLRPGGFLVCQFNYSRPLRWVFRHRIDRKSVV